MEILRHRAALTRHKPSYPLTVVLNKNLIAKRQSFLDYGCGKGDDVAYLKEQGYKANGYDPYFFPNQKALKSSDVVFLSYVLGVIEHKKERIQTLENAFNLAKTKLIVANQLSRHLERKTNYQPYKDGYVTSRKTFEWFPTEEEFIKFLSKVGKPLKLAQKVYLIQK